MEAEQLEFKFNFNKNIYDRCVSIFKELDNTPLDERIETINKIRILLKDYSPFKNEPVDCVIWKKNELVGANDYNPNSVAPPEMELLRVSINNDGYTQPIVSYEKDNSFEVVDGFHRSRVCREYADINKRVHGYLPLVVIKKSQEGKSERMASTIRHNRARGKHNVTAMSDIVLELKNRNWKDKRIAKELGMDEDEILRLCQITGLEQLFKDGEFTKSWDIGSSNDEYKYLTDELDEDDIKKNRTVNTSDPDRIFHTFEKWECNKAGFYATNKEGKTKQECEQDYYDILSDESKFSDTLEKIIHEWKYSCEHYLTNKAMNRIAWLGQAAVCYLTGTPSKFSTGWVSLSEEQQNKANDIALKYLNIWLGDNGIDTVDMDTASSTGRQISIY